jgi:hypothetical protein
MNINAPEPRVSRANAVLSCQASKEPLHREAHPMRLSGVEIGQRQRQRITLGSCAGPRVFGKFEAATNETTNLVASALELRLQRSNEQVGPVDPYRIGELAPKHAQLPMGRRQAHAREQLVREEADLPWCLHRPKFGGGASQREQAIEVRSTLEERAKRSEFSIGLGNSNGAQQLVERQDLVFGETLAEQPITQAAHITLHGEEAVELGLEARPLRVVGDEARGKAIAEGGLARPPKKRDDAGRIDGLRCGDADARATQDP